MTRRRDAHLLGVPHVARTRGGHFLPGHTANRSGVKRGQLPRQVWPKTIELDYLRALWTVVDRIRPAFAELEEELPRLLANAAAERTRVDAGEGKRIHDLMTRIRQRLGRLIQPSELEAIAEKFAGRTTRHQREQLMKQVRAALGADVFLADRTVGPLVEGFVAENVSLIKAIPEEVASRIEKMATRAVQEGKLHKDLAKDLEEAFGMARDKARLVARDQVGKLYGQINAARQKELGITKFIWRTMRDERVRVEHRNREKESIEDPYSYDDPPDGEIPGMPILCRCYAEPVFDDILAPDKPSP